MRQDDDLIGFGEDGCEEDESEQRVTTKGRLFDDHIALVGGDVNVSILPGYQHSENGVAISATPVLYILGEIVELKVMNNIADDEHESVSICVIPDGF